MQDATGKEGDRILIIDDFPAIHEDFRKVLQGEDDPRAILRQFQEDILGEDNSANSKDPRPEGGALVWRL